MRHFNFLAAVIAALCFLIWAGPMLSAADAPAGDEGPVIVKDSLNMTAFTVNSYQKNSDVWSWLPEITCLVNGPIPSGSQLWVECNLPTGPWVKFDCKTQETQKDHTLKVEAGGRDIGEDKGSTYTGPVDFVIHIRNELSGTDSVLFKGKMKVAKARSNETGDKFAQHFVYYVDQDWNLPIGYVYLTPDDIKEWDLPTFNAAFWIRGDAVEFQPHLFFGGKEVGKISLDGEEIGKPSGVSELDDTTTQYVDDSLPQKARWSRVACTFPNIKAWNKTGEPIPVIPGQKGELYMLKDHPGEYELKVLWKNKLARSIKFTVRPDGTFDDSITTANKMASKRTIVPVKIIGDQDGTWDHDAWKTDAFYGNPLSGFSAAK